MDDLIIDCPKCSGIGFIPEDFDERELIFKAIRCPECNGKKTKLSRDGSTLIWQLRQAIRAGYFEPYIDGKKDISCSGERILSRKENEEYSKR